MDLLANLQTEIKKLDEKQLQLEINLLESQVHYELRNIPKARAALTGARGCANSVYVPPIQQAELDLQSGNLCVEESDFRTGYSYFYESFEGFNNLIYNDHRKFLGFNGMILCKILQNQYEEVLILINQKAEILHKNPLS